MSGVAYDPEARASCLRALRLIMRSIRLAAGEETVSTVYCDAAERALRMAGKAESYYQAFRAGHEPTERVVRILRTALAEGQAAARALEERRTDPGDLLLISEKLERAIERVSGGAARS